MTDNIDRALDWDDQIENDSSGGDFITLPAGEYPFEVVGFERERYAGGAKLPACNKAVIEIAIDGGDLGTATIKEPVPAHQDRGHLVRLLHLHRPAQPRREGADELGQGRRLDRTSEGGHP